MDDNQRVPFHGGYIEYFISNAPTFRIGEGWKVKIIAEIIASSYKEKTIGVSILKSKGFTTNGVKNDEYYKNIIIEF